MRLTQHLLLPWENPLFFPQMLTDHMYSIGVQVCDLKM
jgi:hypothetical protein